MSRIDRLDPRTKLYISCGLIALLAATLGWWLLAQLGHANQLANAVLRQGTRAALDLRAHYSHVLLVGWVGIGVVALCAALLGHWLSAELTRPLREAAALAVRVSGGDLSSHVYAGGAAAGGDEGRLAHALQDMNDKLAGMVTQLRAGAEEVVQGAGAIASSNGKLGAQAERQLGALRQAGAAAAQMQGSLRHSGALALESGQLALANRDAAACAAALAAQLCSAIASSQQAAGRLAAMTRTVEDIAFQSQMLAWSSAVEAARADDHGDGMAMLAFDVRLLAQRASEAARDLRDVSEQAGGGLHAGAELAGRAHAAMVDVAATSQRVAQQAAEVASAGTQHETVLENNLHALAGLERTLEDAGLVIGQTATAAAALRDRAGALARMLAMFRLTRRPLRSGGHMYLAASNPDLIVKPARERRGRARIAAVKS